MACCFQDSCGEYSVTPVLIAACPREPCQSPPVCVPCIPRCYIKSEHCEPPCKHTHPKHTKPSLKPCRELECRPACCEPQCRPTCCEPQCVPVKTKYVIPCYRYEDGRIERYVPSLHGRLPASAYQRNGMQDQIHGYRGAIRYLCSTETACGHCCVHTAVEPMKRYYSRITQEVFPIKKKKEKKC